MEAEEVKVVTKTTHTHRCFYCTLFYECYENETECRYKTLEQYICDICDAPREDIDF